MSPGGKEKTGGKESKGPKFVAYFGPVLDALRSLGGSARPREVADEVALELKLGPEALEEKSKGGGLRFNNRVAWAGWYLSRAGYIDASKRGVWTLSVKGKSAKLTHDAGLKEFYKVREAFPKKSPTPDLSSVKADGEGAEPIEYDAAHRTQVVELLQAMTPASDSCERLALSTLK
ncbi:MAG: hypothetical protein FJX54_19920 [Alphaproteobacteria bacterium]|nr:hypothetical protein [Alphaproteobacteria bacterium]